jgi:hypothetical protein
MNVTISKTVEQSLKNIPVVDRESFVNSTLLVALANKEIAEQRMTSDHQSILDEAKGRSELNKHSHIENVDHLEEILTKINSV